MNHIIERLGAALLAAPPAATSSGSAWLTTAVVAVLAGAAVVVLQRRWLRSQATHAQLLAQHQALQEEQRAAKAKLKSQRQNLDERGSDAKQAKRDLERQRKKNHAQQQEIKGLKEALKAEQEARSQHEAQRPAFVETPSAPGRGQAETGSRTGGTKAPSSGGRDSKAAASTDGAQAASEPGASEGKQGQQQPAVAAAATTPKADDDSKWQAKLHKLQAEHDKLRDKYKVEHEALEGERAALRQLKKRVESYRRIDIITKNKLELAEDKLSALGRQYYEAVSELALVKGEVPPPKSRRRRKKNPAKGKQQQTQGKAGDGAPESAKAGEAADADVDEAKRLAAEEAEVLAEAGMTTDGVAITDGHDDDGHDDDGDSVGTNENLQLFDDEAVTAAADTATDQSNAKAVQAVADNGAPIAPNEASDSASDKKGDAA